MKTKHLFLLPLFSLSFLSNIFAQLPVGVNLAAYRDWSSEFVFKDAFKMSREWTQIDLSNGTASSSFDIPLRPDGYPTALPLSSGGVSYGIRTFIFTDAEYPIPAGDFTLITEGEGTIRVRQSDGISLLFSSPGTYTVTQTSGTHFIIDILQSESNDPVRNIRFIMPGFLDSYQSEPFHPEFLTFLEHFQCLRFTAWMRSTGSTIVDWLERTPLDYYSQTLPFADNVPYRGVAYEHMTDLCNKLGKNAWVNIPHMASDDYIQQFALFLRDHLDSSLKIYLEYSNETWNTASDFTQSSWVEQQGQSAGYPGPSLNQRAMFTAKRSADVFRIFESVFGNEKDRLVNVLTAQAGNANVAQALLYAFLNNVENVNPDGIGVNALAIAPFFGNFVSSASSVENALDQAEASLPLAFQRMTNHRNLLSNQGWNIPLIAYEGGQHLNAADAANDALFCEANRHERMGDLYCQYLQYWYDAIEGGLMIHYNSVSPCNANGSWGLKEYTGQPDHLAPKWLALNNCALVGNKEISDVPALFQAYPNPVSDILQLREFTENQGDQVEVFDVYGRLVFSSPEWLQSLDFSTQAPGLYFVVVKKRGVIIWHDKIMKF